MYIGPRRPLTGLNADLWIAPKPGTAGFIAQMLAGKRTPSDAAKATDVPQKTLESLKKEVAATRPSLFIAGGSGPRALDMATAKVATSTGRSATSASR